MVAKYVNLVHRSASFDLEMTERYHRNYLENIIYLKILIILFFFNIKYQN